MIYGKRTLPAVIDDFASETPDSIWASFPTSPESFERGELYDVTFAALSNSISRLAWYLESKLGRSENFETICYLGPSDIRYFILAIAACKCGYKSLFTSPRNSLDAHLSLIDHTDTRVLLGDLTPTLESILSARDLKHEVIPSLDDLLSEERVALYQWQVPFEKAALQPFLVLHTSGSTGLPKPVEINHGLIATIDAQHLLRDVDGRSVTAKSYSGKRVYTALPPFHSAGINFFGFSIFHGTRLILGPCNKPPSVETIERILEHGVAEAAVMAPSLLTEAAADESVLNRMSAWESVTYGGGPLALKVGNTIWEHTKVLKILGSTETFNIPELAPQTMEEWSHHAFHPDLGIDYRSHSDGLHEMVFVRKVESLSSQGAFWHQPDASVYSMKDLYQKHPSKSGLWRYRGRVDDIVVLSNGEKFNPCDAERDIASHKDIKSALIVGQARVQPALLIEPEINTALSSSCSADEKLVILKDTLSHANDKLPAHAQIHESHVKVIAASEDFCRSSKGLIQRAITTKKFDADIKKMYEENDVTSLELDFSNEQTLTSSVLAEVSSKLLKCQSLKSEDNFFSFGMDSLVALRFVRGVKASVSAQSKEAAHSVSLRMIYKFPSSSALAHALVQLLETGSVDASQTSNLEDMSQILEKYKAIVDDLKQREKQRSADSGAMVLLTGSTGSLGSYILDALLADPAVSQVICLNRSGSTAEKQQRINRERGLAQDLSKVEFLEVKLSEDNLGLEFPKYQDLLGKATHIIHNAWPVNFNLPLSAFEDQLKGCCRLIEFSQTSANRASIYFMSSVGAANNWLEQHDGPVPEVPLSDFAISEGMGYAQSKQLAELLFCHANATAGTDVTICRVGQIAGPVKSSQGMWNMNEWFPSLLLGSIALGKLPSSLGAMDRMDWIPVDLLAEVLRELVLGEVVSPETNDPKPLNTVSSSASMFFTDEESAGTLTPATSLSFDGPNAVKVRHIVNPNSVQWADVVNDSLAHIGKDLKVVPFEDWLSALRESAEDTADDNRALKLLDFYTDIGAAGARRPIFSTSVSREENHGLAHLPQVSVTWVGQWIEQWSSSK